MNVVFANEQLQHAPQIMYASGTAIAHPEQPDRATTLLAAATAAGLTLETPAPCADPFLRRVHSDRYLAYLENIFTRWSRIPGGAAEVTPGIQPRGDTLDQRSQGKDGYPRSAAAQAGLHHIDLSSPIGEHTFLSAGWSAHSAAHAALAVRNGARSSYALARPPGHHAGRDYAAGFCYLANTAVAVEVLRQQHARVAVLDVDVHHGNGTQDIFYSHDDVLTVSIHADPERYYPFHWGYAAETGAAEGQGFNLNLPMPRGTADAAYGETLNQAIERIEQFDPGALVVALGLDAHESDPLQGFAITTAGFHQIAKRIGEMGLPSVLVQEGGYLSPALGDNLAAFLDGFRATHGD